MSELLGRVQELVAAQNKIDEDKRRRSIDVEKERLRKQAVSVPLAREARGWLSQNGVPTANLYIDDVDGYPSKDGMVGRRLMRKGWLIYDEERFYDPDEAIHDPGCFLGVDGLVYECGKTLRDARYGTHFVCNDKMEHDADGQITINWRTDPRKHTVFGDDGGFHRLAVALADYSRQATSPQNPTS